MGIEARGGKAPYVYSLSACKISGSSVSITHHVSFDVADSEDEAFGRAMKIAYMAYPQANGWRNHHAIATSLAGIDWIGRANFDKVTPAS